MLCGDNTLVKNEQFKITIFPLPCKCWHCDNCHPARTARLAAEALAGNPNLFITLTSKHRPDITAEQAARLLVVAFRAMRRVYLALHGPHSLPFLAVFEKTKRGWPHIHIVARCHWLEQKWLSKQMRASIGSPIVDVRRIKGARKVARYVTKYLAKNPDRFEGCKRYWRSRDYLERDASEADPPVIPYFYWEQINERWRTLAARLENHSGRLVYHRNHAVYWRPVPP